MVNKAAEVWTGLKEKKNSFEESADEAFDAAEEKVEDMFEDVREKVSDILDKDDKKEE